MLPVSFRTDANFLWGEGEWPCAGREGGSTLLPSLSFFKYCHLNGVYSTALHSGASLPPPKQKIECHVLLLIYLFNLSSTKFHFLFLLRTQFFMSINSISFNSFYRYQCDWNGEIKSRRGRGI